MALSRTVLVVGSSENDRGGIGSVFKIYKHQGFLDNKHYLVSHQKGSFRLRMQTFLIFFMRYGRCLLTDRRIHIVHAHVSQRGSFYRKALVFLLAKLFRKKVIFHVHGSEFLLFFQRAAKPCQRFIQAILNRCDAIIVLSESWKNTLATLTRNANIVVIYNPIVMTGQPKEYPPQNDTRTRFLFLGNIGSRKGVYDILEAVQKIENPNFTISLYGDGEVDTVRHLVRHRGLEQVINVCGWISGEQKAEALRNAHVLLLPSHHEGLPVSILEALSLGMPVLSSTAGGIAEAVQHGKNGLLIEPGDCDTLAEYLQRLASSPATLQAMSDAAYQTAQQKFEHTRIFAQLEALYEQVMANS